MDEVIERDERKHYLKPEQEVRNYFLALNFLEEKVSKKEKFSQKLILDVQKLVEYVNTTDDHPLIVAAVVHYQLVTIHPFEDGNGRTARLLSGYIMDLNGYLHCIIPEGRIRHIPRFGFIISCGW